MYDSTAHYLNADPQQLLTEYGSAYTPTQQVYAHAMGRARPYFNYSIIDEMVMDPRVLFGLLLIKGPIQSNTKFVVKAETPEIEEVIIKELNRFWNNGISQTLEGVEWGFSANEVVYSQDSEGYLQFEDLTNFNSKDVKVITKHGNRVGILVGNVKSYGYDFNNIYLGGPKHFVYTHWRKKNRFYGRSRLWSTLIPWWETWGKSGYRDIRRLWFAKNSFNSGMVRYPKGKTNVPNRGQLDNHDLAMEMAAKMATGHVAVAPSTRSGNMRENEYDWMFDPVKSNAVPSGLFEYGGILRIEILESMGIPYEVVEASGNEGFGSSSGREIPLLAYNAVLFEIIQDVLRDYCHQILDFLLMMRYRRKVDYEIHPLPLQTPNQEQEDPNTTPEDDKQQSLSARKEKTPSQPDEDETESDEEPQPKRKMGVAFSHST